MKESVKKSLDEFVERISPEELDAMLAVFNAEYDALCRSVFTTSFKPEECVYAYSVTSVRSNVDLNNSITDSSYSKAA